MLPADVTSGVYAIICTVSHAWYVGRSVNIAMRWRTHRYELNHGVHINRHLQAAWKKYSASAFLFVVLEATPKDDALLQAREAYWCERIQPRYNMKSVGGTVFGYTLSAETRAKIGAANKGRKPWLGKKHSAETRAKIGAAHLGRKLPPMSAETREKHRQRMLGRPGPQHSAETRAKISAASMGNKRNVGRVLSAETRKKIADAHRGKTYTPSPEALAAWKAAAAKRRGHITVSEEEHAKRSAAAKGRPAWNKGQHLSDDAKAHLSRINTGKKQPPRSAEYRAKATERARGNTNWLGKRHTPEQLAKMSAARRAYNARKREAQRADQQTTQPPLILE